MSKKSETYYFKLTPFELEFNRLESKHGKWKACKLLIRRAVRKSKKGRRS